MKNIKIFALNFALATVLIGCSNIESLGLKTHEFDKEPDHIFWIQLAGMTEELLAILKFNRQDSAIPSSLEQFDCFGKTWNYNLYQLRPQSERGFLAQATGTKNIAGSCQDYNHTTAWEYSKEIGKDAAILEVGAAPAQSLVSGLSCRKNYLSEATFWGMKKSDPGANLFHFQEEKIYQKGTQYFDKSCSTGNCFSSVYSNVRTLWKQFTKNKKGTMFLLRDFRIENSIKKKNISKVREVLNEYVKLINHLKSTKLGDKKLLILMTSSAPRHLELPTLGKKWEEFERTGKNVIYKKSSLLSPVFADGANAENFCGMYEESHILKRLFWRQRNNILNVKFFKSIFNN